MRRLKNKKAQQLVEFLLVAPFLIILLGIVTEYAYALNVNMTLSLGVKTVSADIYKKIKPGFTPDQIEALVSSELKTYLSNNKVPITDQNATDCLSLKTLTVDDNVIILASLKYFPAFTLPNTYFRILPEQFDFSASAVVPAAFFRDTSNYNITTDTITKMYSGDATKVGDRNGIMRTDPNTYRPNIVFLVSTADYIDSPDIGSGGGYLIKGWDGVALPGTSVYLLKKGTPLVYECTSADSCSAKSDLATITSAYSPKTIIFVHDSSSTWQSPTTATDLSPLEVTGVLKRALALTNSSDMSLGNYDNTEVRLYNNVFEPITYKTIVAGSVVVSYNLNDDGDTVNAILNP